MERYIRLNLLGNIAISFKILYQLSFSLAEGVYVYVYILFAVGGVCVGRGGLWVCMMCLVCVCVWYVQCVCGVGMCVHMHVCIKVCVCAFWWTNFMKISVVFWNRGTACMSSGLQVVLGSVFRIVITAWHSLYLPSTDPITNHHRFNAFFKKKKVLRMLHLCNFKIQYASVSIRGSLSKAAFPHVNSRGGENFSVLPTFLVAWIPWLMVSFSLKSWKGIFLSWHMALVSAFPLIHSITG